MTLRQYQVPHAGKILYALLTHGVAHDGSDCGGGKTYCAAYVTGQLQLETLVISPLSVVPSWRKVLAEFGVAATVTNYEKAHRHFGKVKKVGSGSFFTFDKRWPLIIFDECHRTGGDTTLNSKMLIAAVRQGSKILTLSATAADSVMKLKALGYALRLHNLTDYRSWLMSHGATEAPVLGRNGRRVYTANGFPATKLEISKHANSVAMQKLHGRIFGEGCRGSRMRIADIPDFPKTQIEIRLLDGASKELDRLSDELRTFYDQRNTLAQFSEDEKAKLVYWRQAAETAKIPHLLDMAEDALETSRVAIFCNFNRTVDELVDSACIRGWRVAVIRGTQSETERVNAITKFQANELDLIVCNIQAGGVGVNLHDPINKLARTAIICPPWSAVDLKQCLGRVHRDGGGFSRQFFVYFSTGIEASVARTVQRKLDNLSLLNDDECDGSFTDRTIQPALSL